MNRTPAALIRLIATVVLVVVAATLVGAGAGYALSEVRGGKTAPPPPFSIAPDGADTGATGTSGSSGTTSAATGDLRPTIASVRLIDAKTASGRQRRRASLRVRVRVTNRGTASGDLGQITLTSGSDEIEPDPTARSASGGLPDSVDAGGSVTGELRFETAGAVTSRLQSADSAQLRVGTRSVAVRIPTATGATAP